MRAVGVPANAQSGTELAAGLVLATIAQGVIGELTPKHLATARPEPVAEYVTHDGPLW